MKRISFCLSSFCFATILLWISPWAAVAQLPPGSNAQYKDPPPDAEPNEKAVRPAMSNAHERYEGAENQIRGMSRRLSLGKGSNDNHREELKEMVTQAFDAR